MAAVGMLKQTKLTILLSLNAVAIVIAGILIANAIGLNKGLEFTVVAERSDVKDETIAQPELIDSASNSNATINDTGKHSMTTNYVGINSDPLPSGELWNEKEITMYETGDFDLCLGGGLKDLGKMYWQTTNNQVISGFYSTARTWLGYNSETCRTPMISGTGTTEIIAGTYDGEYRDKITVTVIEIPKDQWRHEVLDLVNRERVVNGLSPLEWGYTCDNAATTRATEIEQSYSHTRPDGSSWTTACPIPETGGTNGENLNAGNAAVSPSTTVISWMNSPEHRANILNPEFTKMAVGLNFNINTEYKTFWSQYFSTY